MNKNNVLVKMRHNMTLCYCWKYCCGNAYYTEIIKTDMEEELSMHWQQTTKTTNLNEQIRKLKHVEKLKYDKICL